MKVEADMPKRGQIIVPRITVACPCGENFEVTQKILDQGKGRYCSRPCMYRYRTRPTGLTYNLKTPNPTWFVPGRDEPKGKDSPYWKGDQVGYQELHRWVRRSKTKTGTCEHCGENRKTQWANKSHEYKRDLDDWLELCQPCHGKYDSGEARGSATRKYGRNAVQEGKS
jgi:hypothetical protein